MKSYLLPAIIMFLASCNTNAQKNYSIFILNRSSQQIDSVRITSYGMNTLFTNVLPNKDAEKELIFDYTGKYEGAFLMKIYVNDSLIKQGTFGYYSSVNEIKPQYRVEILDDFSIKEK